jgi:hypothetical protein
MAGIVLAMLLMSLAFAIAAYIAYSDALVSACMGVM